MYQAVPPSTAVSGGPELDDASPRSLADVLKHAAAGRHGVAHLQLDGSVAHQSYVELVDEAARIASGLLALGVPRGAAVVLQLDTSRDFAPAFWACMLGGFIAVPFIVPPSYDEELSVQRLTSACALLGQCVVLASDALVPAISAAFARNGGTARVLGLTSLRSTPPRALEPTDGDATALIVFTSSTTGAPKAVVHHHRGVIAACRGKAIANDLDTSAVFLNWFPLHHVAPLVRMHVLPVFLGCRQLHASTQWVLGDPLRWLDVIAAERVTFTWAPNFALGLINDRADELARRTWELSSLRRLVLAAEPVVARTVFRFEKLLAPHGLRAGVVRASWGMTETASGVTYSQAITLQRETELVAVGPPMPGIHLRVVDDAGAIVEEGIAGHLQVKGTTVTSGYFGAPELTREAFTHDGWLDTGDVGSLRGGELTITGRAKDIIIVNGHNITPHEIEVALTGIDGIRDGNVAAAGFRGAGADTESVAIFVHPTSTDATARARVAAEVRARIVRVLGVQPAKVVAVSPDDLRKGGVGKLQRAQLVRRLEAGELLAIGEVASTPAASVPRKDLVGTLLTLCRDLGLAPTSADDDLFDLGAHSLILAQLLARIQRELGVQLSIGVLFEHSTLTAIAAQIERALPPPAPVTAKPDVASTLLAMCRDLGLAPTSAADDLFDLGAHSLILAQLLARI